MHGAHSSKEHVCADPELFVMQYLGGFQGDWRKTPSGSNCEKKLDLLKKEGVEFDKNRTLVDKSCWWDGFKV